MNLDLVEKTGDHPTTGAYFCPGRNRAPWSLVAVWSDAAYRSPRPLPGRHALELPVLTMSDWWRANREAEEIVRAIAE